MRTFTGISLPKGADHNTVYRLLPNAPDDMYYRERTNRNIGWLTEAEQQILRNSVIGIAGCGGMGGMLASLFCRMGIGEVRIADSEVFDLSNVNRQFGASRMSIGQSKALETARLTRAICDDNTLVVFPQGIIEESVQDFARGCHIILDEIEFWAVGSRILLHQAARALGVPLLNCNAVGFGSRLFRFDPEGFTMEELLGFTYERAKLLQGRIQSGAATAEEIALVMERMFQGLVPELPEYACEGAGYSTVSAVRARLLTEQRASIVSSTPLLASGFLATHTVFELLRKSAIPRVYQRPPAAPGYLIIDAGFHEARVVTRKGSDL
ncbi:MAG TPA: ThiF family adenylyltransferase [Candidatus Paceibacterota bacterium]